MKKILMFVVLIFPLWVFAAINSHPLVKGNNVILPNLDAKTIFSELYAGKITKMMYNDVGTDDEIKLPHVGLKPNADRQMAFLHPIMRYNNAKNEPRFLVAVEVVTLNGKGHLISCRACFAETHLFLFSKENNGYRLLSSSKVPKGNEKDASWGRSNLALAMNHAWENPVNKKARKSFNINGNAPENQELGITRIGANKYGLFYQSYYSQMGFEGGYLNVFILNEDAPILQNPLTLVSEDNTGAYDEKSPLAYSYHGVYSLDKTDINKTMYPIKIAFKGRAPSNPKLEVSKSNKIKPYHITKYFCFNEKSKKYQESKINGCIH